MLSPIELNLLTELTTNLKALLKMINQPDFEKYIKHLHDTGNLQFYPLNECTMRYLNKERIVDLIKFAEFSLGANGRAIE